MTKRNDVWWYKTWFVRISPIELIQNTRTGVYNDAGTAQQFDMPCDDDGDSVNYQEKKEGSMMSLDSSKNKEVILTSFTMPMWLGEQTAKPVL